MEVLNKTKHGLKTKQKPKQNINKKKLCCNQVYNKFTLQPN